MSIFRIFPTLSLVLTLAIPALCQKVSADKRPSPPCSSYVIATNFLDPDDLVRRIVNVLMEPTSFSQKNLRSVIRAIDAKYQRPDLIQIEIHTDVRGLQSVEEFYALNGETEHGKALPQGEKKPADSAVCVRLKSGQFGNCFMYFANGSFKPIFRRQ